jgi:hypothetical protein
MGNHTAGNTFRRVIFIATVIPLTITFIFWSHRAIVKYSNHPVSSSIQFRYGDDNEGHLRFPAISVCPLMFNELLQTSHNVTCGHEEMLLIDYVVTCINDDLSITLEEMLEPLKTNWRNVIQQFGMYPDILDIEEGKELYSHFWHDYIHWIYGPCTTFDTSTVEGFEMIKISTIQSNPSLVIQLSDTMLSMLPSGVLIYLHNGTDIYDGTTTYPSFMVQQGQSIEASFDKKVIKSLPTPNSECNSEPKWQCRTKHILNYIIDKHDCLLPIGSEAFEDQNSIKNKYKYCDADLLRMEQSVLGLEIIKNMDKTVCHVRQPCNIIKYFINVDSYPSISDNTSMVILKIQSPTIEYIVDTYYYDAQSFIGEVGGTLGLLLGLSILSLVDVINWLITKITNQI